ncbi:NAD(P)/FAD-dependent oxidoreductase [Halorientalis brevis]|uniref:NAD(P)/FAD-dependent oxidoreductase n=1 Tax=Halorientalis brevis TaxID=1126241 RepID=A0ABD6CAG1_9EURY
MASKRVAVVGGGAVGVTAARELADAGAAVTLFERGSVAAGSSGRAAGICYGAVADRIDAAVAAAAMDRFRSLAAETRFSFTERPYVWLARDGDEGRAEAIEKQVPRMRKRGRDVAFVEPAALADRFPALRTDDVAVAAIAHDAATTDPATYTEVVAAQARAAGATIETDTEVALAEGPAVTTPDRVREFDAVLVAAGAHTRKLLAAVDVPVPVKAYRVQALVTEPSPASSDAPILYDATAGFYCRPRDGGFLVGDGTEERDFDPDDWDRTADEAFVTSACDRFGDALAREVDVPAVDRSWAGLCTATPDRDPLVGEVAPDLFVAVGWHGHGFMRAPALGDAVARMLLEKDVEGDSDGWIGDALDAFDPTRFDGDEEFAVVEGMTVE